MDDEAEMRKSNSKNAEEKGARFQDEADSNTQTSTKDEDTDRNVLKPSASGITQDPRAEISERSIMSGEKNGTDFVAYTNKAPITFSRSSKISHGSKSDDGGSEYFIPTRDNYDGYSEDDEPYPKPSRLSNRSHHSDPHVLDPDNPLMVKFQKALKDLLEKQLLKLNEEVVELKNTMQRKAREREDLGVNLFNLQEEVALSQKHLSNCKKSIGSIEETMNNTENDLAQLKFRHKEEKNRLNIAKEEEETMRVNMEILTNIEKQLKQWEEDYGSELAVSQRIADKAEKQKLEKIKEKQKKDLLLLRLREAVLGLESKRELLQAQTEIKKQQKDSLGGTIADATADLEALQSEQLRLTRVWNGVVISIQQRDKVYNTVKEDLLKAKESFQLMLSEIEGSKKQAKHEMQHSEKVMNVLHRVQTEYNELEANHERGRNKLFDLEAEYAQVAEMHKITEQDYNSVLMEGKMLSQQQAYQQRELDRFNTQKFNLQMQILEKIQDQSKHDKAIEHYARNIKNLKDNNKNQEMSFILMENQIAKTMVELENARSCVVNNDQIIIEANDNASRTIKEINERETEKKQRNGIVNNKMNTIDFLSKKLDAIRARTGNTDESPQIVRIKSLEHEIENLQQEAEKKQVFWLRLQSNILKLTEERQKQLQKLSLLYKEIHILKQRELKIEHEIEKHKNGEKSIFRQIHDLNVAIDKTALELSSTRDNKELLDKTNALIQMEAHGYLQKMERESIELNEELADMDENNINLNQEILDCKRECLAWEKKIKMASETKMINDEVNKAEGELGLMKGEIHRMEVRFSQLRKVQETLGKDLEHCIMRREALMDQADAREKRCSGDMGAVSNRIVFKRKLDVLTNKTKQTNSEIRNIQKRMESELPREVEKLDESLKAAEAILNEVQNGVMEINQQVEEAKLLRLQKLEMLIRRQKRVRMYTKVKEGKHKVLFRTESGLEAEECKQKSITSDLINVVECVQQHFPNLKMYFLRIFNTLQSGSFLV